MKRLILLAACAVLAACNNTPEPRESAQITQPPAPSAPKTEPPPADGRPVIAAFGDSLTAGFGVDPADSYPDVLQRELDRRGYGYRVVNLGISGDTTSGGLERIGTVLALNPRMVILELGANDGLRGLPLANTRSNLQEMIDRFQQAGVEVVLAGMTLPPNYGPDYVRAFEKVFTDLAKKHDLKLIPFFLEGVAGTREFMQRDGLHPTREGYRKVALIVLNTIEPMLKRQAAASGFPDAVRYRRPAFRGTSTWGFAAHRL